MNRLLSKFSAVLTLLLALTSFPAMGQTNTTVVFYTRDQFGYPKSLKVTITPDSSTNFQVQQGTNIYVLSNVYTNTDTTGTCLVNLIPALYNVTIQGSLKPMQINVPLTNAIMVATMIQSSPLVFFLTTNAVPPTVNLYGGIQTATSSNQSVTIYTSPNGRAIDLSAAVGGGATNGVQMLSGTSTNQWLAGPTITNAVSIHSTGTVAAVTFTSKNFNDGANDFLYFNGAGNMRMQDAAGDSLSLYGGQWGISGLNAATYISGVDTNGNLALGATNKITVVSPAASFSGTVAAAAFAGNGQSVSNTTSYIDAVRDLGVDKAGGVDISSKLQAAIGSSKEIWLPAGSYYLATNIWIKDVTDLTIHGAGRNATLIVLHNGSSGGFIVTNSARIQLDSFWLGSFQVLTNTSVFGVKALGTATHMDSVILRDVTIQDIHQPFYATNVDNGRLTGFRVDQVLSSGAIAGPGIHLIGCIGWYIDEWIVRSLSGQAGSDGLLVDSDCDTILALNGGVTAFGQGITCTNSLRGTSSGPRLSRFGNDFIEGCIGNGVNIYDGRSIRLAGVHAAVNEGYGFLIAGGNDIHGSGLIGLQNGYYGLDVTSGTNVVVESSTFSNNGTNSPGVYAGISITAPGVTISGCNSGDTVYTSASQSYGIAFVSSVSNLVFIGNTLVGNMVAGFSADPTNTTWQAVGNVTIANSAEAGNTIPALSVLGESVFGGGITLGGVRKTSWPAGGSGDVTKSGDNPFTGSNYFSTITIGSPNSNWVAVVNTRTNLSWTNALYLQTLNTVGNISLGGQLVLPGYHSGSYLNTGSASFLLIDSSGNMVQGNGPGIGGTYGLDLINVSNANFIGVITGNGSGLTSLNSASVSNALRSAWLPVPTNAPSTGLVYMATSPATAAYVSPSAGGGGGGSANNINSVVTTLSYIGGTNGVQLDALCGGGVGGTNVIGTYNLVLTQDSYFIAPIHMPTNAVGLATNFWQATVNLIQDGTGNWKVNFDTNYWRFSQGIVPLLQLPANSRSVLSAQNSPYGTNAYAVSSPDFR